jgi:hypothetical protein
VQGHSEWVIMNFPFMGEFEAVSAYWGHIGSM